jgi:nucleoside-diphosphate-sugar epimerase
MTPPATDPIVVTGVSSFVGGHLATHFARAGFDVVGTTSRPPAAYEPLRRARLDAAAAAGAALAPLELTAPRAIEAFIRARRPAVWIHHAGWATNYARPDYDLDRAHAVNVAPLGALYACCRACGCRGVIVTGSSAEYGDSDFACTEADPCWPATAYGLSKLAETIRARQLALEHGLPTRVARVFVPYGPMDSPAKLLPSVVRSLRAGEPIDLSPCRQSRDFLHVRDLVGGYEALVGDLDRQVPFDLFNLSSGRATPLKELLLALADLLEADAALLRFGARDMRPGEAPVSYGANDKARAILRWAPRPLHEGLRDYLRETRGTEPVAAAESPPAKA